jgi:HAD superfamily hydrolase (TIGR01549 family)
MLKNKTRGVIFDLDGTLVDSKLDFVAMRKDLGFAANIDILETISAVDDQIERKRLEGIVHLHELAGANRAISFPGAHEILTLLSKNKIPVGVFTRNSRSTAEHTLKRVGLKISLIIAREDAPPKPDPAGLHLIIDNWGIKPHETLFIGDDIFDLDAGHRAGIPTLLFAPNKPNFNHDRNKIITHLMEIENYLML